MSSANSPYKVWPLKKFDKTVTVPSSKSYSNRALILGALKGLNFKVHNVSESTDVIHLIKALRAIGLKIKQEGTTLTFENSFPECEKESAGEIIHLHTGDGGTTNRFLIALLARGRKEYHLYPTEKMNKRPIEDLVAPLKSIGVEITYGQEVSPWMKLKGPAMFNAETKLEVNCARSTQFASALMLAFFDHFLSLKFINVHASETYLKMTAQVIKEVKEKGQYTVPADFSSASYPLALGAILGRVLITNCTKLDELQADSSLIDVLKKSGADVSLTARGLEVKKREDLRPFNFDVSRAPDLFPTLVFLAAHIEGESRFFNLEVLEYKESHRLQEMMSLFKAFGVDFDFHLGELKIRGKKGFPYQEAGLKPPRDHRIVMAASLFMAANRGGHLYEADCVDKSFPHFFSLFQ